MRELFEYGRLTQYRCEGGETRRLPDGRETGALARRLPAALPAVSGSASRFLTRWDLLGSVLLPINTGFASFSALARTDYESVAPREEREPTVWGSGYALEGPMQWQSGNSGRRLERRGRCRR